MTINNWSQSFIINDWKWPRFNPKYLKFSWKLAESQEKRESKPTPDVRIMKILELTGQDPIKIGVTNLIKE